MSSLIERMRAEQAARLAARQQATPVATPEDAAKVAQTTNIGSVGISKPTVVTQAMTQARQLLSTAEEQLARDAAAGLFDFKKPEGSEIPVEKFRQVFQALRAAQLAKTPDLPKLQVETMENLRQYEELAHILSDEQVAVIVQGAYYVADVKVAAGKTKVATATTAKKAAELTLDDLFG